MHRGCKPTGKGLLSIEQLQTNREGAIAMLWDTEPGAGLQTAIVGESPTHGRIFWSCGGSQKNRLKREREERGGGGLVVCATGEEGREKRGGGLQLLSAGRRKLWYDGWE